MARYRSVRPPPKAARRHSSLRYVITVLLTTGMLATGGFGAFPDNPLTQTFQQVIGENVAAEFLQPVNSYMANLSVPTIASIKKTDRNEEGGSSVIGIVTNTFAVTETPTVLPTGTFTLTPTPSQTATFTLTASPTITLTPTSSTTPTYLPTWTRTPKPTDEERKKPKVTVCPIEICG